MSEDNIANITNNGNIENNDNIDNIDNNDNIDNIDNNDNIDNIKNIDKNDNFERDNTIGIFGDGIYGGTVGNPCDFIVYASDCREHVKCGLLVAFDGPAKPDIQMEPLKDGNIAVTYVPNLPGVYHLAVKYNNKHVCGSPFKLNIIGRGFPIVKPEVIKRNIVKKVKLSGPGMQEGRVNEIAEIYLDISHAEINCELMVDIDGPMEPKYSTVEAKTGIVTLAYTPTEKGDYTFMLRFRGEHVPGSPFTVSIN